MSKLENEKSEPVNGPWRITDTVHSDRKNIFCLTPSQEHHIGTIISGSRSKMKRFEANLTVIRLAPEMHRKLSEVLDYLKSIEADNDQATTDQIRQIEVLLSHASTAFREG